jgi:hypothetical protein
MIRRHGFRLDLLPKSSISPITQFDVRWDALTIELYCGGIPVF